MLMNYDNTIMEILQKITISAVVVLMNCDKLTIKGKITGKNNLIGMNEYIYIYIYLYSYYSITDVKILRK